MVSLSIHKATTQDHKRWWFRFLYICLFFLCKQPTAQLESGANTSASLISSFPFQKDLCSCYIKQLLASETPLGARICTVRSFLSLSPTLLLPAEQDSTPPSYYQQLQKCSVFKVIWGACLSRKQFLCSPNPPTAASLSHCRSNLAPLHHCSQSLILWGFNQNQSY